MWVKQHVFVTGCGTTLCEERGLYGCVFCMPFVLVSHLALGYHCVQER
jgi:hypothetical protein